LRSRRKKYVHVSQSTHCCLFLIEPDVTSALIWSWIYVNRDFKLYHIYYTLSIGNGLFKYFL
jgi:hypothetical protein